MAERKEEDLKTQHTENRLDMLGLPQEYAHLEAQMSQAGERLSQIDQDIVRARRDAGYKPQGPQPTGAAGLGAKSNAAPSLESLQKEKAGIRQSLKSSFAQEFDKMDEPTRAKAGEMLSKAGISKEQMHEAWQQHQQEKNTQNLDHSQQKMMDMLGRSEEGGSGSASSKAQEQGPDDPDKGPDSPSPSRNAPSAGQGEKADYSQSHPLSSRYMEQFQTNKSDMGQEQAKEKSVDMGMDRDDR